MPAPQIEFEAERHAYTVNGRPVPSVTQVLDPLLELWRVPADVLAAAAAFGTHVHQACDLFNRGELDEAALDPALAPYLAGWKAWIKGSGAIVVESELRVASVVHGYAGTLDVMAYLPGQKSRGEVLTLVDIKSGQVPATVGPQTAAYAQALQQMKLPPARRRLCVQLTDTAPFYRTHALTDPADWSVFLSALNVYRFKEKNHGCQHAA